MFLKAAQFKVQKEARFKVKLTNYSVVYYNCAD